MLIAPLSRNVLTSATVVTSTSAAECGAPLSHLVDSEPLRCARFRGGALVESGVNDKIYSGAGNATLNAGWYYSPAERAIEAARALNAAAGSVVWTVYSQRSDGRFVFKHTTGATLGTGSANALPLLYGFAAVARSSATSHTGDYPASNVLDRVVYDLGAAMLIEGVYLAGIGASPAAAVRLGLGDTSAASDSETIAGEAHDDEYALLIPSSAQRRRYLRLDVLDPTRDDGGRTELGYLWAGAVHDTDRIISSSPGREVGALNFEYDSWNYGLELTAQIVRGPEGTAHVAGRAPRERIRCAFSGAPGLDPAAVPGLRDLFRDLGLEQLAFVSLDATNEPARETRMCRVVSAPTWQEVGVMATGSRWSLVLEFEAVDVRQGV